MPSPPKVRAPKRPRLFGSSDVGTMVGLATLGPLSWVLPQRRWSDFARLVGPAAIPFVSGSRVLIAQIAETGGRHLRQNPEKIAAEIMGSYVERQLPYLRAYRPGGWQPPIKVLGLSHIDAALAEKRGTVLWDSHFAFASLVTKIGLWRSGLKVSHLSHPRHGYSSTRFGMRFLNPILTRIERSYLDDRVMLGMTESKEALEHLGKTLERGGVVSVRAGAAANRPLTPPFFDGKLVLGPGAPLLAHKTGAVLLPVFTRRDGKGGFVVRIDAPLDLPASAPRSEALPVAAASYAKRLEPEVLQAPGEWIGWAELGNALHADY